MGSRPEIDPNQYDENGFNSNLAKDVLDTIIEKAITDNNLDSDQILEENYVTDKYIHDIVFDALGDYMNDHSSEVNQVYLYDNDVQDKSRFIYNVLNDLNQSGAIDVTQNNIYSRLYNGVKQELNISD